MFHPSDFMLLKSRLTDYSNFNFTHGTKLTNDNVFSKSLTLPKVNESITSNTHQITATSITPEDDEDWTSVSLITAAQTQKLIDDAISDIDLSTCVKYEDIKNEYIDHSTTTVYSTEYINNQIKLYELLSPLGVALAKEGVDNL